MPTLVPKGKQLAEIDLLDLFEGVEGEISQRYGRIGQGKTYGATVDVLDELKRGHVVYVNWKIDFDGYDQRKSIFFLFGSILFPWKNKLFNFPKENLRYIEIDGNFIDKFSELTSCSVYLDEGHVVFDSYEMAKMSMKKRTAVLHTRHFDRSINIISQRPTAIHRMLRANVNRFYKYEKYGKAPLLFFKRTEYQDMLEENVDEENPSSIKLYWGKKHILNSYNSKYLRGQMAESQKVQFEGFKMGYFSRLWLLLILIYRRIAYIATIPFMGGR